MKNKLLLAISHSRNADSVGFLKEGFLHEDISTIFFPRHNSLNNPFSLFIAFLMLAFTMSNEFLLQIVKVLFNDYLKVDQALVNQIELSSKIRLL